MFPVEECTKQKQMDRSVCQIDTDRQGVVGQMLKALKSLLILEFWSCSQLLYMHKHTLCMHALY